MKNILKKIEKKLPIAFLLSISNMIYLLNRATTHYAANIGKNGSVDAGIFFDHMTLDIKNVLILTLLSPLILVAFDELITVLLNLITKRRRI